MAVYAFQLMSASGVAPFHHSQLDELDAALKSRGLALSALTYDGRVSEEDLRTGHGYVAGLAVPVAVMISATVDGISREEVGALLQLAVGDVGSNDVDVVNG